MKDEDDHIRQRTTEAKSRGLALNATFWKAIESSGIREAHCLTNLRLAMTVVALEQFRKAHGSYPASLAELTPVYLATTPLDLFDGEPLRYEKQGAGYMLYSLGDSLTDYGGRQLPGGKGNISFTVVKAPQ